MNQRIDSILNQTFQDFELIILDDCSTDESRDVIENYRNDSHISCIVYNDVNTGSAFSQWKKGIELAEGEWVWIAESDDWAESEFLSTMMAESAKHLNCGLLVSPPQYCYPDGTTWHQDAEGSVMESTGGEFVRRRMACANPIHNVSSVLMRRGDVLKCDLSLITSMRLCGDWMLYAQMCSVTDVLQINTVLSHYRIHGTNVTSWADQNGLPLIEGVGVLDYLTCHFDLKPQSYVRSWGRTWAKLERQCHFDKSLGKKIHKVMRPYPSICFWHKIYQFRLCH